MNNETGIVRPLSEAEQLKNIEGVEIICDAVQSPGKTEHWRELSSSLDSYTYSAHKFGALKGIGFTFVKDAYKFKSHIVGGGQQNGMRSGTENVLSVQTIKLAIEDLVTATEAPSFYENQRSFKDSLEAEIKNIIQDDRCIVGEHAAVRNINTISFVAPKTQANILMMSFDAAGLEVSSGSACSSGANIPSRILGHLNYDRKQSMAVSVYLFVQVSQKKRSNR